MRIGNVQDLEQPLHASVLAPLPMQRVEADIGLELHQDLGDVATDIDLGHLEAFLAQCRRAAFAGDKADRPLGRPATHQHRDVPFLTQSNSPQRALHPNHPCPCRVFVQIRGK